MIITKAQITRRASKERVPAKTVERDYVLAHAVAAIVASGLGSLVFKGGTALRLIHFEECRYSADLDYSLVNGTKEEALVSIREAFAGIHESQVSEPRLTDGERPRIAYVGPLGKERTLKLDIADDEHVVTTEKRALLPRWPDLPEIEVPTYTLLEIASEKLRCILKRLQCRDLFDLDVLLNEFEVDAIAAAELFRDQGTASRPRSDDVR